MCGCVVVSVIAARLRSVSPNRTPPHDRGGHMRCRSRLARGMRLVRPRRGRSMQAPSIDPALERLAQQGGRRSPLTSPSTAPERETPHREAPYDPRERSMPASSMRRRARSAPVWDEIFTTEPTDRQLLWIDITGDVEPTDAEELAKRFALGRRTWGALQTEVGSRRSACTASTSTLGSPRSRCPRPRVRRLA